MYHNGIHYNIIFLNDTGGVPGSVWHNADDSYTIFIDARLNETEQKKVFLHEMKHIEGNDFEKENVQEIEASAHRKSVL